MSFNERLKNYRYNELQIKSKEAAAILGLEPAHYSHYETGRNRFPIDLLPLLKEKEKEKLHFTNLTYDIFQIMC